MPTAYPSVLLSPKSRILLNDGRFLNLADSGKFGGGSYYTQSVFELRLYHELISSADAATLESFYDSNTQTTDVSITYHDGVTYEGQLESITSTLSQAGLYSVEIIMLGIEQ